MSAFVPVIAVWIATAGVKGIYLYFLPVTTLATTTAYDAILCALKGFSKQQKCFPTATIVERVFILQRRNTSHRRSVLLLFPGSQREF